MLSIEIAPPPINAGEVQPPEGDDRESASCAGHAAPSRAAVAAPSHAPSDVVFVLGVEHVAAKNA